MMTLNEIHYNLIKSTFLQVVSLALKILHTQNMLLRIESTGRAGESGMLLHRKGKLAISKSKSLRLSYSEVVSLPLESILSKISKLML
jgi:hypothetical protein